MSLDPRECAGGLRALRRALAAVLVEPGRGRVALPSTVLPSTGPVPAGMHPGPGARRRDPQGWLLSQATTEPSLSGDGRRRSDSDQATSSATDREEGRRIIALVELARSGDKEAFGQLYDHYQPRVYRFLYYRLGSRHLAEDLTADTFFKALRSMNGFRWQGRDFGAWLMTIARNLATDHFKAGRTRLEQTTEDLGALDSTDEDGPETLVLESLTNDALLAALRRLPQDQQDCLVMRFLQGLSLAETAEALDRSAGAVKQLQLRAVRQLATLLPQGLR